MSPASRRCSVSRCDEPTASEAFPDLVDQDGNPIDYARCIDHELAYLGAVVASATFHESQLEAAQIASEGSR